MLRYTAVACPYFYPTAPLVAPGGRALGWPLGDPWLGRCEADPERHWQPAEPLLRECCNTGYARGACQCFPETAEVDAHRFTVSSDLETRVRLLWSSEKDHRPQAAGELEITVEQQAADHPDPRLARQAWAFARGYFDRKTRRARAGA